MLICFRGNFLVYITIFLFFAITIIRGSHVAEMILDDELPPSVHMANDIPTPSYASTSDEKFCHVEYQTVKRVIGKCVKLGRSLKGCAAGNYIEPMHPECN